MNSAFLQQYPNGFADIIAEARNEASARGVTHLQFVLDGLEHIIADDDCKQCAENVKQAQYLIVYVREALERMRKEP